MEYKILTRMMVILFSVLPDGYRKFYQNYKDAFLYLNKDNLLGSPFNMADPEIRFSVLQAHRSVVQFELKNSLIFSAFMAIALCMSTPNIINFIKYKNLSYDYLCSFVATLIAAACLIAGIIMSFLLAAAYLKLCMAGRNRNQQSR